MEKLYANLFYPGSFFGNTDTVEIPRDTDLATYDPPKGCYGYRFFKRSVAVLDGEELLGEPRDYTHAVFFGEVYDQARVQQEVKDNSILLSNMRCNNLQRVVRCTMGFQPLDPDDLVRPPRV